MSFIIIIHAMNSTLWNERFLILRLDLVGDRERSSKIRPDLHSRYKFHE